MIAFPKMLVQAAEKAGMKVPPDADNFDPEDFPHFHVFCVLQLARSVAYHGEHWHNAEVIAKVPVDRLKTMTLEDFLAEGLSFST